MSLPGQTFEVVRHFLHDLVDVHRLRRGNLIELAEDHQLIDEHSRLVKGLAHGERIASNGRRTGRLQHQDLACRGRRADR